MSTNESSYNPSIKHPSEIVLSENLKQASIHHRAYLREYYNHPEYLQKQAREYAIYRYENFWLPFLKENIDLDIVPPLDILFVWHAHMLSPTAYASDCERVYGHILPNSVRERTPQIIKFSEQLWTKKYNRTMPYQIDYSTSIHVIPPYTSKFRYALNQAMERQAEFYYNISLGHYQDSKFLDEAIQRYKKFLYLKRLNPQLYIVPMYDIDVIWHTHQLFPDAYRRDMITNLQQVLHHDDTTQDRSDNSKLSTSDQETRHRWFELYGDRLPKNGCMYRGKSSKDFYQFVTDYNFLLECQRYTIYVQFIDNNQTTSTSVTKKDVDDRVSTVVSLNDHGFAEPLTEQCFAQFNTSEQEIFVRGASGFVEAHFEADYSDFSIQLILKIQQKSGIWPVNYFSTIEEIKMPSEKIDPIIHFTEPVKSINNSTGEDDPSALYTLYDSAIADDSPVKTLVPNAKRLVVGVPALDVNTIIVRYEAKNYEEVTLDQNYLTQLGTTFLFNLENVKVQQALHNIQPLHQDEPNLLHIRHTILNDINIFTATYNSAIFASCHTLNWSQLPLPDQVSSNHNLSAITMDPETEEAYVIKDHTGDWGIVKFSKNLFTASLEDANNERHYGFSLYRFHSDDHISEEIIYVDWNDDKWFLGSDNFGVEMNTWSISVKRIELKNSMQYICLGATLISRFDTLFTEIFGKRDETDAELTTNGNHNDNDLLANDLDKINLNGFKSSDEKKVHIAMNNV